MSDPDDVEVMTPAEFRVITGWLGLRSGDITRWLRVSERSVRYWLSGRYPVPDGVREQIRQLEASTADAVAALVTALHDAADVRAVTYRADDELWAAMPTTRPLPATWWDQVVARAVLEVPGVEIV